MIDTVLIRALLVKVLTAKGGRPTKALMNQLCELVGELCDEYDEQPAVPPEQVVFERTIELQMKHFNNTMEQIRRFRGISSQERTDEGN
jgi:hypothetical protein